MKTLDYIKSRINTVKNLYEVDLHKVLKEIYEGDFFDCDGYWYANIEKGDYKVGRVIAINHKEDADFNYYCVDRIFTSSLKKSGIDMGIEALVLRMLKEKICVAKTGFKDMVSDLDLTEDDKIKQFFGKQYFNYTLGNVVVGYMDVNTPVEELVVFLPIEFKILSK